MYLLSFWLEIQSQSKTIRQQYNIRHDEVERRTQKILHFITIMFYIKALLCNINVTAFFINSNY